MNDFKKIMILIIVVGLALVLYANWRSDSQQANGSEIQRTTIRVPRIQHTSMDSVLDYFWQRESSCGRNPRAGRGYIGNAGEEGEYQVTPIFVRDVQRISGHRIDPYDNDSCRKGIVSWLNHYAPIVNANTTNELYNLYRRGPTGYRRWKG